MSSILPPILKKLFRLEKKALTSPSSIPSQLTLSRLFPQINSDFQNSSINSFLNINDQIKLNAAFDTSMKGEKVTSPSSPFSLALESYFRLISKNEPFLVSLSEQPLSVLKELSSSTLFELAIRLKEKVPLSRTSVILSLAFEKDLSEKKIHQNYKFSRTLYSNVYSSICYPLMISQEITENDPYGYSTFLLKNIFHQASITKEGSVSVPKENIPSYEFAILTLLSAHSSPTSSSLIQDSNHTIVSPLDIANAIATLACRKHIHLPSHIQVLLVASNLAASRTSNIKGTQNYYSIAMGIYKNILEKEYQFQTWTANSKNEN